MLNNYSNCSPTPTKKNLPSVNLREPDKVFAVLGITLTTLGDCMTRLLALTRPLWIGFVVFALGSAQSFAQPFKQDQPTSIGDHFLKIVTESDTQETDASLEFIEDQWQSSFSPLAVEALYFTSSQTTRRRLATLLADESELSRSSDLNEWFQWLWNADIKPVAGYSNFKADLYRLIDPRFETYFRDRQESARIRLDEIRWGGVHQDGIPPLRNPEMISVEEADYLDDDHIVFGIELNGDARAYPKRILAWHEMFTDTIGGVPIAGVYCTLCGTVIPYRTSVDGVDYTMGTSGFLYRSNKLMYDKATQSLWSTERGEPVLGPLVDKGIALPFESVVTTTWGTWRERHPDTTVLSLNTGHRRDYGEGVAYQEYFATDELMFVTPFNDKRLENKQEVLALRFVAAPNKQLAIDTKFLQKNQVYKNNIGQQKFVVFTDDSGANRVFDPEDVDFVDYDGDLQAEDSRGNSWAVHEEWLENSNGERLARLPYHRAFWFGWYAAFPETQLIQ